MVLVCHECDKKIKDLNDGLVVIVRDNNLDYIEGRLVHKGNCDENLRKHVENEGLKANSSAELSTLKNQDTIDYYLTTGKNPFDR